MDSPRAWIIHWPDWMGGDSVVFENPLSGSEITLSLQHRNIEVTPLYAAPSPAVADGWPTYSEAMFAFEKFSSTPDISVNVCDPFTAWSACVDYYERRKPVAPPPAAPLDEKAERAAFEAQLKETARPHYDYSLKRDPKTGRYIADFVEVHWKMWLARARGGREG